MFRFRGSALRPTENTRDPIRSCRSGFAKQGPLHCAASASASASAAICPGGRLVSARWGLPAGAHWRTASGNQSIEMNLRFAAARSSGMFTCSSAVQSSVRLHTKCVSSSSFHAHGSSASSAGVRFAVRDHWALPGRALSPHLPGWIGPQIVEPAHSLHSSVGLL